MNYKSIYKFSAAIATTTLMLAGASQVTAGPRPVFVARPNVAHFSIPASAMRPTSTEGTGKALKPDSTEGSGKALKPDSTEGSGKALKPDSTEGSGKALKPDSTEGSGKALKPDSTRQGAQAR
jgi:hypothetical protein